MQKFKTLLTVIGAVTVLVLAGNTVAYAATGGKFILGRTNKANKVSVLKRTTSGSALQLITKSSANAPLTVNGSGKVANLNADKLDGLDSTALQSPTRVFTKAVTVGTTGVSLAIPLPAGNYLISYSAFLGGATSTTVGCYMARNLAGNTYFGESRFTSGTQTPGLTGSGFVNLPTGATLTLICTSGVAFTTFPAEPIQVVATRTDLVSSSALRVAPNGARVTK